MATQTLQQRRIKKIEGGVELKADDIVRGESLAIGVVTFSSERIAKCTLRISRDTIIRRDYGCENGRLVSPRSHSRLNGIYDRDSKDPIEAGLYDTCDQYLNDKGVPNNF